MANYTIEIVKEVSGYSWVNTWHASAPDMAAANDVAEAIAAFEGTLLAASATIIRRKVSVWPNPSGIEFTVSNSNDPGDRAMANPEPAAMCLFLNIEALQGRPGRKWLRYSLDESDVVAVGGKPVISGGSGIIGIIDGASTALATALDNAGGVLLIGGNPATARNSINAISFAAIGLRQIDVGWYNKNVGP